MLFTEMLETLDFMRFSGINNNLQKLFTSARLGEFLKNFLRNLRKGVDNVGTMWYNIITGEGKPTIKKDEVIKMKFEKVYFDGVLECGAYIQGADVEVPENYTMLQLVMAIKEAGYKRFMTETMRTMANVI